MNINDWISVLNLDIEVLTAQIYNRLKQKGVMLFNDWEESLAIACDGIHIGGDTSYADVIKNNIGISCKSVSSKHPINKTEYNRKSIQNRVPSENENNIKKLENDIYNTINRKKQEVIKNNSNVNTFVDIMFLYAQYDNWFVVHIDIQESPEYHKMGIKWETSGKNIKGYLNNKLILDRNHSSSSRAQTCLSKTTIINTSNILEIAIPFNDIEEKSNKVLKTQLYHDFLDKEHKPSCFCEKFSSKYVKNDTWLSKNHKYMEQKFLRN